MNIATKDLQTVYGGDSLELSCGDLRLDVLTPWSMRYRRTRFNRAGLIAKVWLKDQCFTTLEETPDNRVIDCGMGLCCEYKSLSSFDADIPQKTQWLKPGVGVLTRGEKPWHFESEERCDNLPTEVAANATKAFFACNTPIVNGFGYYEQRLIEVKENSIKQTVYFVNTGERTWNMREYSHNFLSFNGRRIDEHHHLLLPTVPIETEIRDGYGTRISWNGLNWENTPKRSFLLRFPCTCEASFAWQLYLDDSTASIAERLSEKPEHMQTWGDKHCISPEAFVGIHVQPRETKKWTREWFFSI